MRHVGREPARDAKHRLLIACEEVGLVVSLSTTVLCVSRDFSYRRIFVDASWPDWEGELAQVHLVTGVSLCGSWPGTVTVQWLEHGRPGARLFIKPLVPIMRLVDVLQRMADSIYERSAS